MTAATAGMTGTCTYLASAGACKRGSRADTAGARNLRHDVYQDRWCRMAGHLTCHQGISALSAESFLGNHDVSSGSVPGIRMVQQGMSPHMVDADGATRYR